MASATIVRRAPGRRRALAPATPRPAHGAALALGTALALGAEPAGRHAPASP
jgi:hypothetical protein